ncbi:MAG: putative capsid protein [Cressdnaviricota sp.]|nr:MAG: putative capsid protein [Cressdnaviricota sp.]
MPRLRPDQQGFQKFTVRHRRFRRRVHGGRKARRRLLRQKRMMRSVAAKMITKKAETKQSTSFLDNLDASGADGQFVRLVDINQGLTETNRIGNTIRVKSLVINTQVLKSANADVDYIRTMVIRTPDGQDGFNAKAQMWLQNPDKPFVSQYKTAKQQTTSTTGSYRVLYDEVQEINETKNADWNRIRLNFKKGLEVVYPDNIGDDVTNNNLFLWIKTASANPTHSPVTISFRTYYTDT